MYIYTRQTIYNHLLLADTSGLINFDAEEEAILTCIINGEVTSKSSYTKAKRRASERESVRLSRKSSHESSVSNHTSSDMLDDDMSTMSKSQSESAITRGGSSAEISGNIPLRSNSLTDRNSRRSKGAIKRQMYPVIERGEVKPLSKLATLKAAPHAVILVLDTSAESFQRIVDVVRVHFLVT
jgi:hypothetical protein